MMCKNEDINQNFKLIYKALLKSYAESTSLIMSTASSHRGCPKTPRALNLGSGGWEGDAKTSLTFSRKLTFSLPLYCLPILQLKYNHQNSFHLFFSLHLDFVLHMDNPRAMWHSIS